MAKPFLLLYQFLKNHQKAFWALLLVYFLGALFIVSKLDLEEDIAQLIPVEAEFEAYQKLFKNAEFANRLVFRVYFSDSLSQNNTPDLLLNFCDSLVQIISQTTDSLLVRKITHRIEEQQFLSLYDTILQNLPLFLQANDYQKLAGFDDSTKIEQSLLRSFKALNSPVGAFLKKTILVDPLGIVRFALQHFQAFQIDDNFDLYQGYILTKDRKNLLFFLTTTQASNDTKANAQLIKIINTSLKNQVNSFNHTVQCEFFGAPAVAVSNAQQIRQDIHWTVSIALIVLFTLLFYFFRRKRIFFYLLIPTIFGAVTALSILMLWKGKVSLISIGIGSVLLGITIDYAIHFFTHLRQKNNIEQVLQDIATPVCVSSLTTAGAFFCLFLVRSEALHDLGLFAGISVLITAVSGLIMLPILSSNFPTTKHTFQVNLPAFEQKRWLVLGVLLLSFFFIFTEKETRFEEDLNQLNYLSNDLKQAEQNLNQISSATLRGLFLMAKGKDLEEVLAKIEEAKPILDTLLESNKIGAYTPISNILMSQKMQQQRIEFWQQFWTPEKRMIVEKNIRQASKSLNFKENAFDPFFKLLNQNFQPKPLSTFEPFKNLLLRDNFSENVNETTLLTLLRVPQESKPEVQKQLNQFSELQLLDRESLTQQLVQILKIDFDHFVHISMIGVFLLLWLAYGRIELAIITFIPILLSWQWTLGWMHWLDIKFNIANIIIATFIFGLGIDYSIFIMRGLLQAYKTGEHNLHSYKTSILLSALTTLTGIGVLIFAQHPALKSIALLSIIGILSVLLLALTLEPLLFHWLVKRTPFKSQATLENREYPITFLSFIQAIASYTQLTLGCTLLMIWAILLQLLFFLPTPMKKRLLHSAIWGLSKVYIFLNFPFRETRINPSNEKFSNPAVIISNHQSIVDTPLMFRLNPKVIILTKDWVHRFPLFGGLARMADFYSVSEGFEKILPRLREKVAAGYSIAIFPEGGRSPNETVQRFHKGAFYLAEKLELDILPIWIHGTGRVLRKGTLWGKWGWLTMKIGERIKPPLFSTSEIKSSKAANSMSSRSYSTLTKQISRFYKNHYALLRQQVETPDYFREKLIENYIYKGPILEWYMRVKTKMENNYHLFNDLVPRSGIITDIGCGYGFMAYMLAFTSEERDILGIDYDENKIKVAQNCTAKTAQINFETADVIRHPLRQSDVFILADVLHYLKEVEQFKLLENCRKNLKTDGLLLIRDGDSDLQERHQGTRLTEIFSTKSGFNKTQNPLFFLSGKKLETWAKRHKFHFEKIDVTKHTSNVIFALRKK